jgi:hypothetical protein
MSEANLYSEVDARKVMAELRDKCFASVRVSLADYPQVDTLGVWYGFVNFTAGHSLASLDCCTPIDR